MKTSFKKNLWVVYINLSCLFCFQNLPAQDIHFTQFYTNPLILSPANTGYFKGNYRLGLNYKYQWPWATDKQTFNYHSQAAYVDFSFLENKVKSGWMGIGINFLNDEAGDGRLRYMHFGGSLAWHQAFDRDKKYVLSVGFSGSYIMKTVDFSRFYYHNQWVEDEGFNTGLPTYENPNTTQVRQLDLGAGLNMNAQVSEKINLRSTFSMLHINRPLDQFYVTGNRLGIRYNASLSAEIKINKETKILSNAYFTYQRKAYEIIFGGLVAVQPKSPYMESKSTFFLGAYYRFKDAFSPTLGYQYKNTRLLVNYDVLLSSLSTVGKLNGGLEFSFVHIGAFPQRRNENKLFCPKF